MIIALNNIRSLHNVGAIFRTSDGAGVEKILLGGLTPTPPRAEISKTALGAVESVSWEYVRDLSARLQKYKNQGWQLVALEQTDHSEDLYTTELSKKLVVVVGHEREGIEAEILDLCDVHVHLLMRGQTVHSLNVSNATAITLYEIASRV